MPQCKMVNGFETYIIHSQDHSSSLTCVPRRGGALSSIVMAGTQGSRELLYQHDIFWDDEITDLPGGWPFAFPVFARLERQGQYGKYLYDGKLYELAIHGFAWQQAWQLESQQQNRLTISLCDNEQTRSVYPFQFKVTLEYEIHQGKLTCRQTYTNLGDNPMPYSAAFHPYFLTPAVDAGKADVSIQFSATRRYVYNASMTDIVGETDILQMPASAANPEINEQLSALGQDKEMTLTYSNGECLHLKAEGEEDKNLFPYVQLYTIPEKSFFCMEPLMSIPNALNTVSGMRWLAPQQSEQGLLTLWLT